MFKKFFNLKIIAALALIGITGSITSVFLFNAAEGNNTSTDSIPKAAIIDQLYDDSPNQSFHQRASELLEKAGYKVDIFTTKDITVDFYKNLPSHNYKFVIVRSHGVADKNDQNSVTLFTGERYTTDKYISEQLLGQVKKGAPLGLEIFQFNETDSQWTVVNDTYRTITVPATSIVTSEDEYFLITPTFIDSNVKGKFSNTIFLLGGCSTMKTDSMAKSLINRGASSVIGWDNKVGAADNDTVMLRLLDNIFSQEMELEDAVDSSMKEAHLQKMPYPARLIVTSGRA